MSFSKEHLAIANLDNDISLKGEVLKEEEDVGPSAMLGQQCVGDVTGAAVGSVSLTATNSNINLGCYIPTNAALQNEVADSSPVSSPEVVRQQLITTVGGATISAPHSTINYVWPSSGVQVPVDGSPSQIRSPTGPHIPDREEWDKLIKVYKKEESWLNPFPWSHDTLLEQEDFYVPLMLDVFSRSGKERKDLEAKLDQLFDPVVVGGQRATCVLVRGDAGHGKSTLCQKVVYDWAHGKTAVRELPWESIVPVLFRLRRLDHSGDIGKELFKFVHSYYSPKIANEEATKVELHSLGKNLVVILDGYDEIGIAIQRKLRKFLEQSKDDKNSPFSRASFLVTSRPTNDKEFLHMFEKQFFISKMTEQKANQLISSFYRNNTSEIKNFRKQFAGLKLENFSPLTIFTLCWLGKQIVKGYTNNIVIVFSYIHLLTTRCNIREGYYFSDEKINEVLRRLGMLCHVLSQPRISEKLLEKCFEDELMFVVNIGILKYFPGVDSQEATYEPLHKLFFDSLAEKYIENFQASVDKGCIKDYSELFAGKCNIFSQCLREIALIFRRDEKVIVRLRTSGMHSQLLKESLYFSDCDGNVKITCTSPPPTPKGWPCEINLKCWDPNFTSVTTQTVLQYVSSYIVKELGDIEVYRKFDDLFTASELMQSKTCSLTSCFTFYFEDSLDSRVQVIKNAVVNALRSVGEQCEASGYNVHLWMKSPDCHVSKDFYSYFKRTFADTDTKVRYKWHSKITGLEPVASWDLSNAYRNFNSLRGTDLSIYWHSTNNVEIIY